MMKFRIQLHALAAALMAVSSSATSRSQDDCPVMCTATPVQVTTGTPPPAGVTFLITPTNLVHGTAPLLCESTCTICTVKLTVAFNGVGTYEIIVNNDGAGWSSPVGVYARHGFLKSRCRDGNPGFACVQIAPNGALPASSTL